MLLTLSGSNEATRLILPQKISGNYPVTYSSAGKTTEIILMVEADGDHWVVRCGSNSEIIRSDQTEKNVRIESDYVRIPIYLKRTGEKVYLTVEQIGKDNMAFKKVVLNRDGSFSIGYGEKNDISVTAQPGEECRVKLEYSNSSGFIVSEISGSGNIYKNWRKIQLGKLSAGDMILIGNSRFVFGKCFIAYDRCDQVSVNNRMIFSEYVATQPTQEIEYYFDDEYEHSLFFCSPRLKKELKPSVISVEYPPQPSGSGGVPVGFTLGPSITMGLSSAVTAGFTVTSQLSGGGDIKTAIPSIVMASSMLLSSILWPVATRTYEGHLRKSKERKRKVKYIRYLRDKEELIDRIIHEQDAIIRENNPSLECLVERIGTRDRALWERMSGQNDFLNLCIGTGDFSPLLTVNGEQDKFSLDEDVLRKETDKLFSKKVVIENGPIEISLIDSPILGIIGNRSCVLNYMKTIITQLVALYSYDDLGMVVIYDPSEHGFWECFRWFPHIWNDDKDIRMIASNADELKAIGVEIEKIRNSESSRRYVLISASRRLALKADFIGRIIDDGSGSGFSVIALYDLMNYLPKECSRVIELTSSDKANVYRLNSEENGVSEITVPASDQISLESLAVALSNIKLANNSETFTLPSSLAFLEMIGVDKIEHLNCLRRWSDNNPVESLKAPIGIDSHGDLCMLDLHQKYHGPHGLIAGMTGSGKSEFIMTMILSMAVNYHPDELSFILIDYKGGGMANAFKALPHTAGIITNLGGTAIKRSLAAIESELKRRQRIFEETEKNLGTSNMDIYKYQKLYREKRVERPLSHLMIVSDEFAELKDQQPDFMDKLISAARIGRSLGIHLILATQKPSGVVSPQIWSNSKFKICLKVQEKADSVEMIKRPDAAALVEVGRFYLQVGYNEYFELGQSAWCGAVYDPDVPSAKKKDASVRIIDQIGRTIIQTDDSYSYKKKKTTDDKKQLDSIVEYIASIAEEENISTHQLWLEPVPEYIILSELLKKYQYTQPADRLTFAVGECDIPKNQEQSLLAYDVENSGNMAIFGAPGSGKTTFLTTAVYNLAFSYSPEQIWFYIFDFNAQTMRSLNRINHVGDVVLPDDKDKVDQFFKWISRELQNRRKVLSETDGNYYNYVHGGNLMPWITVIFHNLGAFIETYPEHEDRLIILSREGIKYGINFIFTGITINAIRIRLLQNCKTQITMQLNDDSYGAIFSSLGGLRPSPIKGRGLALYNDQPVEFQTAYVSQSNNMTDEIETVSKQINDRYNEISAYHIPVLTEAYKPSDAAKFANGKIGDKLPIAMNASSIEPYFVDFERSFIVVTYKNGNANIFLQGAAELLSSLGKKVVVCDLNETFLDDAIRAYDYYTDPELFAEKITAESDDPSQRKYVVICGTNKLLSSLKGKLRFALIDRMKENHENGRDTFVCSDRSDDTNEYSGEDWFRSVLNSCSYIWAGNGLSNQSKFTYTNVFRNTDVKENYGYIVENGDAVCVQLLVSEVFEVE